MFADVFYSTAGCDGSMSPCCAARESAREMAWIKKVDRICRVALAAFAAALAPALFVKAFSAGVVGGAVYTAVRTAQHKSLFPAGESKPVCAQGYMDFLSGMRFPPIVGSLATATFIGAHMRHDPVFYVPFCSFFVGFWIGRDSVSLAGHVFSKLENMVRL